MHTAPNKGHAQQALLRRPRNGASEFLLDASINLKTLSGAYQKFKAPRFQHDIILPKTAITLILCVEGDENA